MISKAEEEVYEAALGLSNEELVDLLHRLLVPTPYDYEEEEDQEQIDDAWAAEIKERLRQIDDGEVEMLPIESLWEEMNQRRELREKNR
ncbi:hypothetical protein BH09SUM1_BH09SUM1_19500 [soil metagenome]